MEFCYYNSCKWSRTWPEQCQLSCVSLHVLSCDSSLRVPSGLLWQLRPSDVEVELLAHTRNVVSRDLEEETGLHTGWIQNGGLFIASNKQRLDEYKRLMSVRWFGHVGTGFNVKAIHMQICKAHSPTNLRCLPLSWWIQVLGPNYRFGCEMTFLNNMMKTGAMPGWNISSFAAGVFLRPAMRDRWRVLIFNVP